MAEKEEKETRPYPPEQLVEVLERIAVALERIAAAPEMYEALKAQHGAIDLLFAMLIKRDKDFFPSKSGQPWDAMIQGNKALAKAEGKE